MASLLKTRGVRLRTMIGTNSHLPVLSLSSNFSTCLGDKTAPGRYRCRTGTDRRRASGAQTLWLAR